MLFAMLGNGHIHHNNFIIDKKSVNAALYHSPAIKIFKIWKGGMKMQV